MTEGGPSGWFYQRGWWIGGAGASGDVFVSVHEHYHDRLQNSTSFGAVTYLLGRIAELTGDDERQRVSDHFTGACRRTQEGFATWASAAALGLGPADLDRYPDYRSHLAEMEVFATQVGGAYLRFHLCQAIARACMQSEVAAAAVQKGLGALTLADLRNVERPDHRLMLLRRSGFNPIGAVERIRAVHTPTELAWMTQDQLAGEMFHPSQASVFGAVNLAFFDEAAGALERLGCPTLATDGHLDWTQLLIDDAEARVGGTVGIEATGPSDRAGSMWAVMRTCESEQLRLPGPLLPARMIDPVAGVDAMVAGTGTDAHLYVAFREMRSLLSQFEWLTAPPTGKPTGVFLRRSVLEAEGQRVVEWMDVSDTGPGTVGESGIEVLCSVAESLMPSEAARRWRPYLGAASATLLSDLRLADRLRYWAASGGLFRCCFLSVASFGRSVPVMIGRFEMDGSPAHVLVRPLTSSSVGCYRQVFAEMDPAHAAIVEDSGFMKEQDRLINFTLAHLIGEESVFEIRDG